MADGFTLYILLFRGNYRKLYILTLFFSSNPSIYRYNLFVCGNQPYGGVFMNGNGSRLVSIVTASALALSSVGCSVFGKKEQASAAVAPVASVPTKPDYDVDATTQAPAAPDLVKRTYNAGSGRTITLLFEPEAYQSFSATLGSAAYLCKIPSGSEGKFELQSALVADTDRNGIVTLAEARILKTTADGKVSTSVGTPGEYLK